MGHVWGGCGNFASLQLVDLAGWVCADTKGKLDNSHAAWMQSEMLGW